MTTDALFSEGLENPKDLQLNEEKLKDVPKWTNHKLKESGFYLIYGKHYVYKFKNCIALVEVEKDKVYLSSVHIGYKLSAMYQTRFLGPFSTKEELENAKERIERDNS